MATYREIATTETEPLSPVTSSLMSALAVNPTALAEGASGAPRIFGEAFADPGDGLDVLTVAAADTYSRTGPLGAGYVAGELSTTSGSEVVGATYTITSYTGSMRFKCDHDATGSASVVLRIYKNGSLVQTWSHSGGVASRSADISIVPTDVVEWRHYVQSGTGSSQIEISVNADELYVEATAAIKASENYYE